MTLLRSGSATDVGKVRSNNQDQLLVAEPLFAVADGMGGHAAGEVASLTAVEALRQAFNRDRSQSGLVAAGEQANRAVWDRAAEDPALRGMGTTLVAMALVEVDGEERLAIINVGDSRLYLLRQGELEQLTNDHSLVQELVDIGELSEADAAVHPQRNVLTRALGVDPSVVVDELQILPVKGDRYLLCSDGLPREVTDDQMASIMRRLTNPRDVAKELVAQARAHGGNDNITVVVVDVIDDGDAAAAASAALADDPGLKIPSTIGEKGADGDDGRRPRGRFRRSTAKRDREPRSRPITFRVVGFLVLLTALVAAAFAAIGFYARGSYFVGVTSERLIIYKGRPGGLLWFQPTLVERTDVTTAAVLPSRLGDLQRGRQETSLADARRYVDNLKSEGQAHGIGTTTTTSTVPATTTTVGTTPLSPDSATTVPATTVPATTATTVPAAP